MKQFIFLIVIVIISLIFFSCKKKEVKIIGNWEYVYLKASDTINVQSWLFNEDKSLIRTVQQPDTIITDTANYSLDSRFLDSPNLLIKELNSSFDGTYEILTLNKEILIIQRILLADGSSAGAFMRAEFVKK